MKGTLFSIIALLLLVCSIISCKKVSENDGYEINKLLDEDDSSSVVSKYDKSEESRSVIAEDKEELKEEELAEPAPDPYIGEVASQTEGDEDVEKMKSLLLAEKFTEVVDMRSLKSDEGRYYTGIAYYALMKQKNLYPNTQRTTYRDKAISLLKEVSRQRGNASLRARALLWYAMTLHLNYSDIRNKRLALDALLTIQRELHDTEAYDDSYVIAGIIYTKMGWFVQARRHYNELKKVSSYDGRVWDPENRNYYLPQDAAEIGLEKVRKLCYPDMGNSFEDTQPVQSIQTETTLQTNGFDETNNQ